MILLDTNICIYAINRRSPGTLAPLRAFQGGDVGISAVTYAELRFGDYGKSAFNPQQKSSPRLKEKIRMAPKKILHPVYFPLRFCGSSHRFIFPRTMRPTVAKCTPKYSAISR